MPVVDPSEADVFSVEPASSCRVAARLSSSAGLRGIEAALLGLRLLRRLHRRDLLLGGLGGGFLVSASSGARRSDLPWPDPASFPEASASALPWASPRPRASAARASSRPAFTGFGGGRRRVGLDQLFLLGDLADGIFLGLGFRDLLDLRLRLFLVAGLLPRHHLRELVGGDDVDRQRIFRAARKPCC